LSDGSFLNSCFSAEPTRKRQVNVAAADWLRTNAFISDHDSVVLIHGYGGRDGSFPMALLRDGKFGPASSARNNPLCQRFDTQQEKAEISSF